MSTSLKSSAMDGLRNLDVRVSESMGKIRLLFAIKNNLGFAVLEPIITMALENPAFEVKATLEPGVDLDHIASGETADLIKSILVPTKTAEYGRWHFVFYTDVTSLYFRRRNTHIILQHGTGIGNLDRDKDFGNQKVTVYYAYHISVANPDIVLYSSDYSVGQTEEALPESCDKNAYLTAVCGSTKVDAIRSYSGPGRDEVLQDLGLSPENKTLVVFSHWTPKSLLKTLGRSLLDSVAGCETDYNVIVTGHRMLWQSDQGEARNPELRGDIEAACEAYPNIRFLPCFESISPLLYCSDVLMVDNSSAFMECCIMDRPILFFDHPKMVFQDLQLQEWYREASDSFSTAEEVPGLLEAVLANPGKKSPERTHVLEQCVGKPGSTAGRILELVETLGRVSGRQSPNWEKAVARGRERLSWVY